MPRGGVQLFGFLPKSFATWESGIQIKIHVYHSYDCRFLEGTETFRFKLSINVPKFTQYQNAHYNFQHICVIYVTIENIRR